MRKVVVSEFLALDGVFEEPGWSLGYGSDEQDAFKMAELEASGALLLGRVTYEGFAAAWPGMESETGDYGVRMNSYPKYVVTSTLDELSWTNSSRIGGDIFKEIAALKQGEGRDLLVFGSGQLVNGLLAHGLVDELRLMIYPVLVGQGKRLFAEGADKLGLEHLKTETFSSGVVVLTYGPER